MNAITTDTKIEFIKGVGPQKAEALQKELNIFTVGDLLNHYPFRYEDRSKIYSVKETFSAVSYIQLYGFIVSKQIIGTGASRRLIANFRDSTGEIELVWFQGIPFVDKVLQSGSKYLVFGKPNNFNGRISIPHPEIELITDTPVLTGMGFSPVYPLTEGMKRRRLDSRFLSGIVKTIFAHPALQIPESLPEYMLKQFHFPNKTQTLKDLHIPVSTQHLENAQNRIKFEEFFQLQVRYQQLKSQRGAASKGIIFDHVGELFNTFYHQYLPFELTNAQKQVIRELRTDMKSGKQMNRLLQGDVGSGKTIVALLSMLIAADNGYQSCLMAPTEILATQHFLSIQELLADMPVKIALLTGSTSKKKRTEINEGLVSGEIKILIGTHALIEDNVVMQKQGLVIIDEQHRFGVAQRARLWNKKGSVPHVLVMTATPIPRTLALTVYGDLDVSTIAELPAGRKPIVTVHRHENTRPLIMQFLREQIAAGRQVYVVFPLIEESSKLDLKSLMAGYDMITSYLPTPEYKYSIVHGKLKAEEKEYEMQNFKNHKTQIMIATTVIEVGVNVPNASVMIIENAERFGLAQLHQLRGRVGRGAEQSYCILITGSKLSEAARKRLKTMVRTNDGFEIAQVDMELRGPGDMDGTRQSGILELKLADIKKDEKWLILAREKAEEIISKDPALTLPENANIRQALLTMPHRTVWSRVS